MDVSPWDLLLWGSVLGAVAFIWGIANDDGDLTSKYERELQKRLARHPASAGAVVIKAQRARALKRMLPGAILALPPALAVQFVPTRTAAAWLCEQVGPAEASHWLLRMFFPGLLAVLAVAAAFAVVWALRVLRGGYAPPLDTIVFHDTIAVTGWRAKLHAWLVLTLMPLMVAVLFYVTHGFVQTFDTEANRQALIAAKRPNSFATKAGIS